MTNGLAPSDPVGSIESFLRRLLGTGGVRSDKAGLVAALASSAERMTVRGEISRPDARQRHLWLVESGCVGRYGLLSCGARQMSLIHLPGECCNVDAVIVSRPSYGLTALGRTTVLRIPIAPLCKAAASRADLALALFATSASDVQALHERIVTLGRGDARARLAKLLCDLGSRTTSTGQGTATRFPMALTQSQVADVLGMTAVHVNRTLRDLREAGIAEVAGRMVVVFDAEALEAAAASGGRD